MHRLYAVGPMCTQWIQYTSLQCILQCIQSTQRLRCVHVYKMYAWCALYTHWMLCRHCTHSTVCTYCEAIQRFVTNRVATRRSRPNCAATLRSLWLRVSMVDYKYIHSLYESTRCVLEETNQHNEHNTKYLHNRANCSTTLDCWLGWGSHTTAGCKNACILPDAAQRTQILYNYDTAFSSGAQRAASTTY